MTGDVLNIAFEFSGVLLGLPVAAGAAVVAWRLGRRLHVVHEAVVGRPASQGVEKVPSMVERFQTLGDKVEVVDDRLSAVEAQVHPNSGSSLRDRVDAIAKAVGAEGT